MIDFKCLLGIVFIFSLLVLVLLSVIKGVEIIIFFIMFLGQFDIFVKSLIDFVEIGIIDLDFKFYIQYFKLEELEKLRGLLNYFFKFNFVEVF